MATCIRVLMWADFLAVYAIWVMMTYLTDVWKLSFTHAAGILNIWGGIVLSLPTGFAYLVDTVLGNFRMVTLSSIAYSIGLGFLSMSTPPVLHKSTGTCSKYEPECIGHTQKTLFYTALALIAVGMSGHIVSLKAFILEQSPPNPDQSESHTDLNNENRRTVQPPRKRELIIALFVVVGGIALPYIKPWSIRFGIPAICTVAATFTYIAGSCFYRTERPQGSPLTNILRVFVASASKIGPQLPSNPNSLYKGDNPKAKMLSHTEGLRCLDKAAIELPDQQKNRWRLCTVTEVEETKIAIHMIPLWMTFIMCGVVASAGSTYFQEQANHLSTKLGKIKVPLPILFVLQQLAKSVFCRIYNVLRLIWDRYAPPVGIAIAMIFSILCCVTAAKVEARRLHVVRSHDLVEKPEETIPMTIFWLLPQFVLLAGLEAFFDQSVKDFFSDQSPTSMEKYFDYFTHGISGVGYMASVLSVFVVGKISERGGKRNWFQYTLSKSRLDNYYWTLAGLSAVNLMLYILAAMFYPYREPASRDKEQQNEEQGDYGLAAVVAGLDMDN